MEKNPEKSSGIVLPVLISVLAAVIVSAGGFGLGYGTGFVLEKTAGEPSQSLEQPADETGRASSVTGSSFGPNVRVENGTVTWRSDEYLSYLGAANVSNQTQAPASSSSGETAASGTYTHDFSGGRVLATTVSNNNNDPVYHTEDCSAAKKISPDDEYWYASAADAEADGRRLCGICGR